MDIRGFWTLEMDILNS